MPIPANWSVVTVTAQYINPDGSPSQGEVKFDINTPGRIVNEDAAIITTPLTVVATLDADGRIEVDLPASDDPDVAPAFTWQVTEYLLPNRLYTYEIEIPYDVATLDLSHTDEVTGGHVIYRYLLRSGDTMTGYLTLHAHPTSAFHAATKQYVDDLNSETSQDVTDAMNAHLAAFDPHGDRAWSQNYTDTRVNNVEAELRDYTDDVMSDHTNAVDPHGDRAYTDAEIIEHANATDPHGDRLYTDQVVANALLEADAESVSIDGDTMTGFLTLHANPSLDLHAATRQYVDGAQAAAEANAAAESVSLTGDTMTGPLVLSEDPSVELGATPKQYVDAKIIDEIISLLGLSSGVIQGGELSPNVGDPTMIDIADTEGLILDYVTDPGNPSINRIAFAATSVTIDDLVSPITWLLIDSTGAVVQQTTRPTNSQRRTHIVLGRVFIFGGQIIDDQTLPAYLPQPLNQLYDLMDALGPFNVTGNILSPASTDLTLAKTSGTVFSRNFNLFAGPTLTDDPHISPTLAQNPVSLRYMTQASETLAPTQTTVDPANYDNAGNVTAIGGGANSATIQRVFLVPLNDINQQVVVQYGQHVYGDLEEALLNVGVETFALNPNLENALLIGYIVISRSATNLSDDDEARVIRAARISGNVAGSGGSLSLAVLLSGSTMTGPLILSGDPTDLLGAATKQYVDAVQTAAQTYTDAEITTHTNALDPHGDRAYTDTEIVEHTNATDPHGDRAYADTVAGTAESNANSYTDSAITTHTNAIDPHGDRAYVDTNYVHNDEVGISVASLVGGLVPSSQLPAIAITETYVVASEAEMLALSAQIGDIAIRTDTSESFVLGVNDPSVLVNWYELLSPPAPVTSVNSQTGEVVLGAADVGADPAGTASTAVTNHVNDTDPHGDRAYADATFSPLDHVHDGSDITTGTVSTDRLSVGTTVGTVAAGDHTHTAADVGADPAGTAASEVSDHVAAIDPHGDRAYSDSTFIPLAEKGAANGVAPLDAGSLVPQVHLPELNNTLSGDGAPGAGLGEDGDFYIDTTAWDIYGPKDAGAWPAGVSLIGPSGADGTDGQTVLSGAVAPTTEGVDGDFYIDTNQIEIYGPKTAGEWGDPVDLVGPRGKSAYDIWLDPSETTSEFRYLRDDFESGTPSAVWDFYANGAANTGGRLRIPVEAATFANAYTFNVWKLEGSHVDVEMPVVPVVDVGTEVYTTMYIRSGVAGTLISIVYNAVTDVLTFSNQVSFDDPDSVSIAYSAVDHRWLRIREERGTLYWETSSDGVVDNWVVRRSTDTPSWVYNNETLGLTLEGFRDAGASDFGEFDNLGLALPTEQDFLDSLVGTDGAGAVQGFHNVLDYGAVGDGSTDDTVAIQNALDQVLTDGGGEVFFPGQGRIYSIDGPLRIYRNTTLTQAPDSVIRRDADGTMLLNGDAAQAFGGYTGHGNIIIQGGTWDANGTVVIGDNMAISIGHAENVTVRDTIIKDVPGFHAIEFNATRTGRAINVKCLGFIDTGSRQFSEAIQIDLAKGSAQFGGFGPYDDTPCDDILIQGCTIAPSGTVGTTGWGAGVGSHSFTENFQHTNIRIVHNDIQDTIQYAVRNQYWNDSVISNNTITGCGAAIWVETPTAVSVEDVVIANNTMRDIGSFGHSVFLDGAVSRPIRHVNITGNVLRTNAGSNTGFRLVGVEEATVTGNTLRNIAGTAISQANVIATVVTGNRVYESASSGISCDEGAQCIISDNSVALCNSNGIHIIGGTDISITNNVVKSCSRSTNGSGYGYRLSTSLSHFSLTGNRYRGHGSGNEAQNAIGITSSCSNGSVWGNDARGALTVGFPIVDDSNGLNISENISFDSSWFAFVPVFAGSTTNPSVGAGSIVGAYARFGNTVHFRTTITFGSGLSAGSGNYTISLPYSPLATGSFNVVVTLGASSTPYTMAAYEVSEGVIGIAVPTGGLLGSAGFNSNSWTDGNIIAVSGTFEAPNL